MQVIEEYRREYTQYVVLLNYFTRNRLKVITTIITLFNTCNNIYSRYGITFQTQFFNLLCNL